MVKEKLVTAFYLQHDRSFLTLVNGYGGRMHPCAGAQMSETNI